MRYWLAIMPEENFKFTIARQIFAYPSRIGERARSQIEPGDRIVVFVSKQGCEDYCGSFAAVLEVAGPWRNSESPMWPDEVREGKVKYDPVVDVKVVAKGKVEVGEVAGELSRILGREVKGGAELRMLMARRLPEAAGRLIEEMLARLAEAMTQAPPAQASPPSQAPATVAVAPPSTAPQYPAAATTAQVLPEPLRPLDCSPERLEKLKDKFKAKLGRDLREEYLELAAAAALEGLGFDVEVEKQVAIEGGELEIDVWGEKDIGGSKFYVYVSCKNNNPNRRVGSKVVGDEAKRVAQLLGSPKIPGTPHMRILVVSSIWGRAKHEALDKGFIVVEVGMKVDESNVEEACRLIYDRLSAVFGEIASALLPELANLADELRGSLQELEVLDSRLSSMADKLNRLLRQAAR